MSFNRKAILILGAGKTGKSLLQFALRKGYLPTIVDSRDLPRLSLDLSEIKYFVQIMTNTFDTQNYHEVWISSSFSPSHPWVQLVQRRNHVIYTDVDLFVDDNSKPLILITGTNGKSTVVYWLQQAMNAQGISAIACGNFGLPLLDCLDVDCQYYIVELSSYQLYWSKAIDAEVSMLLNVEPDHLEWHGGFDAYKQAKQKVFLSAKKGYRLEASNGEIIGVSSQSSESEYCLDAQGVITSNRHDRHVIPPFYHGVDRLNFFAVAIVLSVLGLDLISANQTKLQQLNYRGEETLDPKSRVWVNNSKATNIASSAACLQRYMNNNQPVFLLLGGVFKEKSLGQLNRIKGDLSIIFYGKDGRKMRKLYEGDARVYASASMLDAMKQADAIAPQEAVIVLAPGCASFDAYSSFESRGAAFNQYVEEVI